MSIEDRQHKEIIRAAAHRLRMAAMQDEIVSQRGFTCPQPSACEVASDPGESFLYRHGRQIGAALCGLSALVMVGVMALLFAMAAPEWIEVQERLTSALSQVEAQK